MIQVKELDPNESVLEQLKARKRERDARFRAAAHRRPQALPAPEQKALPAPLPPKINPFDFLSVFQPVNATTDEVTFVFPLLPKLPARPIAAVIEKVAAKYRVTVNDIKSARRTARLAQPRFEAAWIAKNELLCSMSQIARALGDRDRATIIHAVHTYEHWRRVKAGTEAPTQRERETIDWEKVIL